MKAMVALALAGVLASGPSPTTTAATPPGRLWEIRRLEGDLTRLNDVACNDSCRWIAVGDNGVIRTTFDVTGPWDRVDNATTLDLKSITWTGTHWVAVGGFWRDYCQVLTSTDGLSWTTCCLGDMPILNCVEASPTGIVALGDLECLATSPDLLGWSTSTAGFDHFADVVWTGAQYVAVGSGGLIKTSPDGSAWTTRNSGVTDLIDFNAVCSNGTKIVVGGFNSSTDRALLVVSDDGVSWTQIPTDSFPSFSVYAIEWTGTAFVATGGTGHMLTSTGGSAWNHHQVVQARGVRSLHWDDIRLAGVGDGGLILTATSSHPTSTADWIIHQTSENLPVLNGLAERMTGTSRRTILVGDYGTILTTDDGGQIVSERVSGVSSYLEDVTSMNLFPHRFIAVGSGGTILTSPEGETWTPRSSGTSAWLKAVDWFYPPAPDPYRAIAVGEGGKIVTSSNGISWSPQDSKTTADLEAVANGLSMPSAKPMIVAVGADGTIVTSSQEDVWTARDSGTTARLCGVAALDGGFVAVGAHGTVASSEDGIAWDIRQIDTTRYLHAVCWTGSQLVATGEAGIIFTSPDGSSWTRRYGPVAVDLNGVTALNSGRLLAVGNDGIVLSSDPALDFTDWIASESPPSGQDGPEDDPNHDGHDNLVAYGFHLPAVAPTAPGDLTALPRLVEAGAGKQLLLRFLPHQDDLGDLAYIIEASTTLATGDWTELLRHYPGQPCSSGSLNVMKSDSSPFVAVEFPESYGDHSRYFVRTRVALIAPP